MEKPYKEKLKVSNMLKHLNKNRLNQNKYMKSKHSSPFSFHFIN